MPNRHDLIPEWASSSVAALKDLNIINGKNGHLFDPSGYSTRAESATILIAMMEYNELEM